VALAVAVVVMVTAVVPLAGRRSSDPKTVYHPEESVYFQYTTVYFAHYKFRL
jgi:hypothetical protein